MAAPSSLLETLRGRLIVSCQAYPGEPLRLPEVTARMAQAVVAGGAVAVRVQGLEDIRAARAAVDVPVIGLWKDGSGPVFITPTLEHARSVQRAGADVIALDGTRRPRPDGLDLAETVRRLRAESEAWIMADCGSLADAQAAEEAGVDFLGTTLSGYTDERPAAAGPDLELIARIVETCALPVIAEGRIRTPQEARLAIDAGALAVCVGTAITHPTTITRGFADLLG